MLRCEALLGWCKNTLGRALVPHEVLAAVVGGIVRYAAPYLSDPTEDVVRLNAAIKNATLQFENAPKAYLMWWSGKGLKLPDIRFLCRDSVVVFLAQLTHHSSALIKGELRTLLDNLRMQYGV